MLVVASFLNEQLLLEENTKRSYMYPIQFTNPQTVIISSDSGTDLRRVKSHLIK